MRPTSSLILWRRRAAQPFSGSRTSGPPPKLCAPSPDAPEDFFYSFAHFFFGWTVPPFFPRSGRKGADQGGFRALAPPRKVYPSPKERIAPRPNPTSTLTAIMMAIFIESPPPTPLSSNCCHLVQLQSDTSPSHQEIAQRL